MSVSALDKNLDWTFGSGRSNYYKDSEEIAQNVLTRLKSFKNDWFLDINAEIDWLNILSTKNNEQIIIDEVTRVTASTFGVRRVKSVSVLSVDLQRGAKIEVAYVDIFNNDISQDFELIGAK